LNQDIIFSRSPTFSKKRMIEAAIHWVFQTLAVPEIGLASVLLISFISATLLPLGSEPAVFAAVKAAPNMFWALIWVATIGNTLGGMVDYWIGFGARQVIAADKPVPALLSSDPVIRNNYAAQRSTRWFSWLERYGARTMLLAWLPGIGDPICTLAGWLRLPFWPSIGYMAIGKFLRYLLLTWLLLEIPDGFWRHLAVFLT
jgi:membrane protein YqaA with SNARE-associated domain